MLLLCQITHLNKLPWPYMNYKIRLSHSMQNQILKYFVTIQINPQMLKHYLHRFRILNHENMQNHLMENWAEVIEMEGESVKYKNTLNGKEFINGEPGYSSIEISLAQNVKIIGDDTVDQLKNTFDGRVAG